MPAARNARASEIRFIYAEGVQRQSPGSRSAPWAIMDRTFGTLKGCDDESTACRTLLGCLLGVASVSQGALRDPGLWS